MVSLRSSSVTRYLDGGRRRWFARAVAVRRAIATPRQPQTDGLVIVPEYGRDMSNTRYGHSGVGGGDQDQAERKDEGWERRQGGDQSREPGSRGEPAAEEPGRHDERGRGQPPPGTNTQGELAGIGEASERSAERIEHEDDASDSSPNGPRDRDVRGAGTDQPPRMGGPLGPDPDDPHLPEGAQDAESRGSGAGGFDVGVNAKVVGAVHQGARVEETPDES
jgi:hypothetical protein